MEAVAIDQDVNREDRGSFYSRWRRSGYYKRGHRQRRWSRKRRTARWWGVLREPEFCTFCGKEEVGSPPWVATMDRRVSRDEEHEARIVVDVKEGKLILCIK